jgi:tetratricopeptide (TPR) repeat protein
LGDLYRQLNLPAEAAVTYATGIRVKYDLLSDSNLSTRIKFIAAAGQLWPLAQAYRESIVEAQWTLERTDIVRSAAYETQLQRRIADSSQMLGYVEIQLHNDDAAIAAYEQAMAIRPTFEAYKNLGILYDRTGAYEQARQFAQLALEIAQKNEQTDEISQLESLLQLIEREVYVRDNPTDYQAHYALAELYHAPALGRSADALEQARLAAEHVPAGNAAEVYKVNLRLGDYALESAGYETATVAYEKALAATPQDFSALYGLARAYDGLGRTAEALSYANSALLVAPADKAAEVQALVSKLSGTP